MAASPPPFIAGFGALLSGGAGGRIITHALAAGAFERGVEVSTRRAGRGGGEAEPPRSFELRGQRYACRVLGAGPALLALHGFTGTGATWLPLAAALGSRQRVLAPDLLGHGASSAPRDPARYRLEQQAADLLALLDQLGEARVDLLGYSMGGRLALAFALAYPARVRRLLLESTSAGLDDERARAARRAQDERWARLLEHAGLDAFVREWEQLPLWASQARLPQATRAALRAQRSLHDPHGLAACLRGSGQGVASPGWCALPQLDAPVTVIVGALDEKYTALAARWQATLRRAALTQVTDAGHAVHLEQPQAFADVVTAALARRTA